MERRNPHAGLDIDDINDKGGSLRSPVDVEKELVETHEKKEVTVHVNKNHFLYSEIVLSANLQVKCIRPDSPAIHNLLIGDQIVTVSGQLVNSVSDLLSNMKKVQKVAELVVIRQRNRTPATRARISAALSISIKHFSAPIGYQYFVATLKKIQGAHLGLRVQQFRDKITVTEVDENSIGFYNYMVGDNILDVNCVRLADVKQFREVLKTSLKRYNTCTTLVERPDSETTLHKSRVLVAALSRDLDPNMAHDVIEIGNREARRYSASISKVRILHSAFANLGVKQLQRRSSKLNKKRENFSGRDDAHKSTRKSTRKSTKQLADEPVIPKKSGSGENADDSDSSDESERATAREHRKRLEVAPRHVEEQIATDALNPLFLQKVPKHKPPPSSLTFFTKFKMFGNN